MLRRRLKADRLFVDYFNAFLRVAAFPVKLHYNIDDDSFSYRTSADSLPWNPLVLTASQKDVMFQWLEKERYELFKTSSLCFEHNLCAKLTSPDTSQTSSEDNELQEEVLPQVVPSKDTKSPQKSESPIQEKLVKPKKPGDYTHFIYESILPATQSLKVDEGGRRASIKRSPSLSKIEEEDSASDTSACSGETSPLVPLKPPVKFTSLQDFSHRIIKSPLLPAIEEESVKSSTSPSPCSTPYSATTLNRGIMQSLMDQKIEHASRHDDEGTAPIGIDVSSDLDSVSLDPAIWSDSDAEQITNTEESPLPSKQFSKLEEKHDTPAMNAIGSVEKMSSFKAFLNLTNGAILLHYWMGAEHLKHLLDHNDSELWNMTLLFKEFQSKYSYLLRNLGYPPLATGIPHSSWLTSSQDDVLVKLKSYWLPRFMIAGPSKTPEEFNALPAVSNDQGVAYNKARCKPVFKSYGKSAGCFDLGTSSDSLTGETSPEDPFYIGMMTNKNAGNPFHKYLVSTGLYQESCLFDFWEATEEYISLIEQYMPHSVAMQKAWLLWRTFLVEGSPKWIHLTRTESQSIYTALQSSDISEIARALNEQQAIVYSTLKQHWKTFLHQDYESLKECVTSDDLTFRSSTHKSEEHPKPKAKKKVRIKAVAMRRRIRHKPTELDRVVSLDSLAKDQRAIAAFESYLVSIYGSSSRELHSLQAWKAIGNYRRIPENKESQRIAKSIKIHKTFIYQHAKKAVNVPEPLRDNLQVMREFNTPTADKLEELQKALVPQFENVLQKYIQGSKEVMASSSSLPSMDWCDSSAQSLRGREGSKGSVMGSVALLRVKKTRKHFSVDGDLAASLQSSLKLCLGPLNNKMTAFLEFLRAYGPQKSRPLLHKNLLFWYEVERYKIMFMSDPDNLVLKKKIEAIVDCYLDTAGPPWLQVDIPINLANQIIDLTREYLQGRNNPSHSVFVRESELLQDAQDFIFQELLPFWASFLHKSGHDTRAASRSSKPSVFRSRATSCSSKVPSQLQLPPIASPMFGQQMLSYSIMQGLRWKVSISAT